MWECSNNTFEGKQTKQHKWHKEIKAWADGATIQWLNNSNGKWVNCASNIPSWTSDTQYRIKPATTTIKGYVNIYLYDEKYPSYGRVIYESKGYAEEQGVNSTAYLKTVEISENIEV